MHNTNITTCDERLAAGAGDNGDLDFRISLDSADRRIKLLQGDLIQRVKGLGPIDGNDGNSVDFLSDNPIVGDFHCLFLLSGTEWQLRRSG